MKNCNLANIYMVIMLPLLTSCAALNSDNTVPNYESRIVELTEQLKNKDHQISILKSQKVALLKANKMNIGKVPKKTKAKTLINPEELEFEIPQGPEKMLGFIQLEHSKSNFKKSLTATDLFIQQYSKSKFLDQVYYYRALNYKSLKQFAFALKAFSVVENKFLLSPFRPDSLLQKAEIYQIMNLNSYQQRALYKLMRQYPKSKEARLAHLKLNTN